MAFKKRKERENICCIKSRWSLCKCCLVWFRFSSCGVLPACTSFHSRRAHDDMKKNITWFKDLLTTNCYCMAICMYVVALVNRISFDEGEEMNKVIDAINQTCCPSLRQLGSRRRSCGFRGLTRSREWFLRNIRYRGNIMTYSQKRSRRTVPSLIQPQKADKQPNSHFSPSKNPTIKSFTSVCPARNFILSFQV